MEPENFNTSSDYSHFILQWRAKIKAVVEKIERCKIIFDEKETLFLLVAFDLNIFLYEGSTSEESEIQNHNKDLNIQETVRFVSQVDDFMESISQVNDLAKDHLQFITSHISHHACKTQVRETNDLIEKFETMVSELCELTKTFEDAVTGIQEKVQTLIETNGAT
ncbi:hypothetical protein TNCV_2240421 [Trichonephila clavipes]|nr:hypothetical protein TNCV_2240421 [Trichonephila clavipes]